ncbi:serine/threonine-protein kinase [Nocardia sp. alder85J]|uniref:serine/threonine-protein kinase n=1 Tax=Nocardia sp. alder85J TaxID=2862949 RepID=UPI001CD450AF|nr:serine/threonine-protein kinase [Nocardia sp. alder85J]MCX4093268.1 protein kinase [Nocardia sp. alder85J]
MNCRETGCTGTIVDGYCDSCGTAPLNDPGPPAYSAAPDVPDAVAAPKGTATPRRSVTAADLKGLAAPGGDATAAAPRGPAAPDGDATAAAPRGFAAPDGAATAAAPKGPGAPTGTVATAAGATGGRTMRTRTTSGRRRNRLGAGLVEVPPVPRVDPATAVLANPQVPESKRFCAKCEQPVGRGQDDRPGRTAGFCAQCGTRFSFSPKLSRGDLVGDQYEVAGALAHGGLGWIYLAIDRKVSNRWVVLKGLLNTADPAAIAAALAERRFLAQVEHPNIVKIFNFVEHTGSDGVTVGYIVMEYVGGTSLDQLLRDRLESGDVHLPPAQAIAYVLDILPALGYLHGLGLAYCDFKPGNIMLTAEQPKLIDLGAVIALDDEDSPIYGTIGYQAPEIARTGPTVASEVYTIGRTLAVLMMNVPQRGGHFAELPGPDTESLLADHDCLYRFLLRATDLDPDARFGSVEELAEQLTGVLREVLATTDGHPRPPERPVNFGPPRAPFGIAAAPLPREVVAALPVPLVDTSDAGAALLAATTETTVAELETALAGGSDDSVEIPLRLIRAAVEAGAAAEAHRRIGELTATVGADWRLAWFRGAARLVAGEFDSAAAEFDAVYSALPGEAAPKLALAVASELGRTAVGAEPDAETGRGYETVWRTDHAHVAAAFGLARLRRAAGDRDGAVAVLDEVEPSSALYAEARIAAVEALLYDRDPAEVTEDLLRDCGERVARLVLDSTRRTAAVRSLVLETSLRWLAAGHRAGPAPLLGNPFDLAGVRAGLESCYRAVAHDTGDMWGRFALVQRANEIRPRSVL